MVRAHFAEALTNEGDMSLQDLEATIEQAWEDRDTISPDTTGAVADAINEELMEDGFIDLARILSGGGVVVRLPEQETDAFHFAARIEQMMVDFRIIEVPARISWQPSRNVSRVEIVASFRDVTSALATAVRSTSLVEPMVPVMSRLPAPLDSAM